MVRLIDGGAIPHTVRPQRRVLQSMFATFTTFVTMISPLSDSDRNPRIQGAEYVVHGVLLLDVSTYRVHDSS